MTEQLWVLNARVEHCQNEMLQAARYWAVNHGGKALSDLTMACHNLHKADLALEEALGVNRDEIKKEFE